jgi:thiamine-phosphate pyrophosphorylase
VSRTLDRARLGPVYAIADADALGDIPMPEAVAAMAEAGIRTIQIRAKGRSGAEQHRLLTACLAAVGGAGEDVDLWIDDRADLAALFPGSRCVGVHVGQRDLPPAAARRVVGNGAWIGLSTHDEAQVEAAELDPDVDLVAVGPIFPTASKERPDPVVGLDFLRRARRLTGKPLVAIGGIGADEISSVLAAGADAAVVLSAVCRGGGGGRAPHAAIADRCRQLRLAAGRGSSRDGAAGCASS